MSADTATIHIDGAARGNPGPAACAYVIARPGVAPVERAERIGTATNNVAEYTALLRALEAARDLGLARLDVYSDSELLVKQMNGDYSVKNPDLRELYDDARALLRHFQAVMLTHVRREHNRRADQLCNEALDGRPGTKGTAAGPKSKAAAAKAATHPAPTPRDRVQGDAVECLRAAARAWGWSAGAAPTPEQVWDQLWSVLEEAGVLKAPRGRR
jgi:ribonuclease HI